MRYTAGAVFIAQRATYSMQARGGSAASAALQRGMRVCRCRQFMRMHVTLLFDMLRRVMMLATLMRYAMLFAVLYDERSASTTHLMTTTITTIHRRRDAAVYFRCLCRA